MIQILSLLGLYFDAVVVEAKTTSTFIQTGSRPYCEYCSSQPAKKQMYVPLST